MRFWPSQLFAISSILWMRPSNATPISARDSPTPGLPYDANTTQFCSWWADLTTVMTCSAFLSKNFVALDDFLRWNPSFSADCSNLTAGKSYCVEALDEPAPAPGTTPPVATTITLTSSEPLVTSSAALKSSAKSSTPPLTSSGSAASSSEIPKTSTKSSTITSTTTTSAGNGITTPQPTQPGMVSNCNKFHWIDEGVSCSQVISYQKITLGDFVKWNPTVGTDCAGMWARVNVCVGVIGGSSTTAKPSTTTSAGNGVQTLQPTQPSMVKNCAKFHWVANGVTCDQITSYQKISMDDFVRWNPTVKSDCTGLQADVNVCVGLIGATTTTKPTTTTSAGNGIQTPQPIQPGMVNNCKKFHYVAEGVLCSQITSYNKITLADFAKWNTGVGSDCRSMWAKTYVCVGV